MTKCEKCNQEYTDGAEHICSLQEEKKAIPAVDAMIQKEGDTKQ